MSCEGCEVSLLDFNTFKNKNEITNVLISHGVLKDLISCPKCSQPVTLNRNIMSFKCQRLVVIGDVKKKCNYSVSPLSGTFLSCAKLDLKKFMHFICYLLFFNPPRQTYFSNHLKLATQTVVERTSYFREVFVHWLYENHSKKIGGQGFTIEIDEAKVSIRKYNGARRGKWVFTGLCRETKDIFVVPVLLKTKDIILQIIREKVSPGTSIVSDIWETYDCLEDENFIQLQNKHSLNYVVPEEEHHNFTWYEVHYGKPRFGSKKPNREEYIAEYLFKEKYSHLERVHHYLLAAAQMFPGLSSPDDPSEVMRIELRSSRGRGKKKNAKKATKK